MADLKILLIGVGGFGANHLKAWQEMGLGKNLYVAELDKGKHGVCSIIGLPPERIAVDCRQFLEQVDVVDIVTPSTTHFDLCTVALDAGKDVFVEKPMTMTSKEAETLAKQVEKTGRLLQVGYYYRYHPISRYIRQQIRDNKLGDIRCLSGNFMGFKRARTDVGVTHTDAIHFLDLFNWFVGSPPNEVYAITRDHFKRGMEDFSMVVLQYANGASAKIEAGYIQPGRWRDKVVPDAFTSKDVFVCGSQATVDADFETEQVVSYDVHHEWRQGTWWPVFGNSHIPNVGTASPVQMIRAELTAFLDCVKSRQTPGANVVGSGTVLARLMEGLYTSAREHVPSKFRWNDDEIRSVQAG